MNPELFDMKIDEKEAVEPAVLVFEFELFDHNRPHVVMRQSLTEQEAIDWTMRLAKSFCPHLRWRKTGNTANQSDSKCTRRYVIRKF